MWGRPWPWVWSKRTYWRLQAVNVWWKCMVVGALQVTLRQLSARWRSRHRQRRSEPRDHTGFAGASQSKRLEQCYRHTAVRQSSLRLVLVLRVAGKCWTIRRFCACGACLRVPRGWREPKWRCQTAWKAGCGLVWPLRKSGKLRTWILWTGLWPSCCRGKL